MFFVYLNIWWVHGVHKGGYIQIDNVTSNFYFRVVGNFKNDPMNRKLLDVNEDFRGVPKEISRINLPTNIDSNFSIFAEQEKLISFSIPAIPQKKWIRFSADVVCNAQNWDEWRMTFMGIKFYNTKNEIKNNSIKIDRLFFENTNQTIFVDASIPSLKIDSIQFYFQQLPDAKGSFDVKNIKVESFNE